jgi:3-methyladenine DNA glycosylase AlkD
MNEGELVRWIDGALRAVADEKRRAATVGYFPTSMEVLGVSVPRLRKVVRELRAKVKEWSPERVLGLSQELVDWGTHESRQSGYELLDKRRDARSLIGTRALRRLGAGNDNWASVDTFSVLVAGPVWREGRTPDREILRWAASKDLWWRRAALVSTVPLNLPSRGGTGDPERTYLLCRALASDREPMVAKALSWALRSLVGVDPEGVARFLDEREDTLPGLVRREVRNKLTTGRKAK